MSSNCDNCSIKEEFLNLATVVRDVLDDGKRFTWSEKAKYKNKIDEIIKRISGSSKDDDLKTIG